MFLMETAVLCVEAMLSRYLGCGKSPCGHGVSCSVCLKHRDPSERLFSGARIAWWLGTRTQNPGVQGSIPGLCIVCCPRSTCLVPIQHMSGAHPAHVLCPYSTCMVSTQHMYGVHTAHVWCPHSTCMESAQQMSALPRARKCIILGTNGAAVDRHGPILSQNGATSLRKLFKYLPGLRGIILISDFPKRRQITKSRKLHTFSTRAPP